MSRWRSVWLVARREILERGRSRGFVLSVFFTTALVIGSFIVPAILFRDDEVTQIGVVEPAPPGLDVAMAASSEEPAPSRATGEPSVPAYGPPASATG